MVETKIIFGPRFEETADHCQFRPALRDEALSMLARDPALGDIYFRHGSVTLKTFAHECFVLLFADLRVISDEILLISVVESDGSKPPPPGNRQREILKKFIDQAVRYSDSGVSVNPRHRATKLEDLLADWYEHSLLNSLKMKRRGSTATLNFVPNHYGVGHYVTHDLVRTRVGSGKILAWILAYLEYQNACSVTKTSFQLFCNIGDLRTPMSLKTSVTNGLQRSRRWRLWNTLDNVFTFYFADGLGRTIHSNRRHYGRYNKVIARGALTGQFRYYIKPCLAMLLPLVHSALPLGYRNIGGMDARRTLHMITRNDICDQFVSGLKAYTDHKTGRRPLRESCVRIPVPDVKEIRTAMSLSQKEFAERFGFSLSAVRNWEQGIRKPEQPVALLLHLIQKHPNEIADDVRTLKTQE